MKAAKNITTYSSPTPPEFSPGKCNAAKAIVSIDVVSTVAFGGTGARFGGQGNAGCGLLVSFRLVLAQD
ncbi:hypothetical protein C5167_009918 [Papaver somniferum]|uniref:Uncharacterized protein n=1 Tax=Papaver somniferum TaxID=3469 RepID=A0A4Y7JYR4_PAPSO|nr:hypothetical protein C5167_009918 [Papaver somniferum]